MENKIALLNCLSLHYYTNASTIKSDYSALIKNVVATVKTPVAVGDDDDRATLVSLKKLVMDLTTGDVKFERNSVLQKIRIFSTYEPNLLKVAEMCLPEDVGSDEDIATNISTLSHELSFFTRRSKLKDIIKRASFDINLEEGNFNEIVDNLREAIAQNSSVAAGVGKLASEVQVVMSGDNKGMAAVFEETKQQLSGKSLKSGWKGLNRMLGCNRGFVPGELWIMPALPHNAKTLFSLLTLISFAVFNDASDFVKEGKKALLLDISLENDLNVNLPIVCKALFEHFEKQPLNIENLDTEVCAEYINQKVSERGWEIAFERHINTDFRVDDIGTIYATYEAKGYQIVACRPDYLGTINRSGLGNGTIGSDVREVYRRARNINTSRKSIMLAPHQLSPEAKKLKAMDPLKYVRLLPGKGLYDGCTTVDNEADGELYFGITETGGNSYFEVQRGKHRTIIVTPEKQRYMVMRFQDIGTLPWDEGSDEDYTLRSVNQESSTTSSDMFASMGF